jgi:hypothetical protein
MPAGGGRCWTGTLVRPPEPARHAVCRRLPAVLPAAAVARAAASSRALVPRGRNTRSRGANRRVAGRLAGRGFAAAGRAMLRRVSQFLRRTPAARPGYRGFSPGAGVARHRIADCRGNPRQTASHGCEFATPSHAARRRGVAKGAEIRSFRPCGGGARNAFSHAIVAMSLHLRAAATANALRPRKLKAHCVFPPPSRGPRCSTPRQRPARASRARRARFGAIAYGGRGIAERIARRMRPSFEELDYRPTPLGALSLRRRRGPAPDADVFEIKLGDEYLMSSRFTASEIALAELGIAALSGRSPAGRSSADRASAGGGLEIVVGGLGLGYTAQAVLAHDAVGALIVVELFDAVIDWHRTGLLPLGPALTGDARCRLVEGDFFALAGGRAGFDPARPGRRFDAILVDIDHSPAALLDGRSGRFYRPDGLRALAAHLAPGGVFGLWSNDRPDPAFTARLAGVFADARAEPVTFDNPLQDRPFTQTVYLARTAIGRSPAPG